jgi:hypothetical protein
MTELQIKHMQLNLKVQHNDSPKKIKVTSAFADYLDSISSIFHEKPNGFIAYCHGIPIEIDDTIDDEYYELVY